MSTALELAGQSAAVGLTGTYEIDLLHGARLRDAAESLQWMVGDYVSAMRDKYEGTQRSLLIDLEKSIGIPLKTLEQYSRVARTFAVESRSSTLPYSHHLRASVAEHPVEVIRQAEAEGLSVRDTERLAKGLPVGGEAEAKAQSSAPTAGSSLEEAAIADVAAARQYLERAWETMQKPGIRLTVPVGQAIYNHLAEASKPFMSLEKHIKEEISAYLPDV